MTTIVVGIDGSSGSVAALRSAVDEGRLRGWPVTAVMAWQPYPGLGVGRWADPEWMQQDAEKHLDEVLENALGEVSGSVAERVVRQGPAAHVLVEASRDAALLVVGCRGNGGFGRLLLGSVSQQCAQHAACPVLVVRTSSEEKGGSRQ